MDGLKSLLNRKVHRFNEFIRNVNERRNKNTGKFSMTCFFLTLLYPVFIVLMAELNQDKYPSKLVMFIVNKPMVMVFDIVVAAAIFAALCLLFRKVWRAVAVQSIVYFMLSITELFKYGTNGNHLIMTDMKLIRSVKSLTSFAYIKITPRLVTYTIIVLAYIALTFWFNPKIKISFKKSVAPAVACAGAVLSMFFVTAFSTPVYSFFNVDTTAADNVLILNEKFENNSFLAFFASALAISTICCLPTPISLISVFEDSLRPTIFRYFVASACVFSHSIANCFPFSFPRNMFSPMLM